MDFQILTPQKNRRAKLVKFMMPSIMKQLGLDKFDAHVAIVIEKDSENLGATYELGSNIFFICLEPVKSMKDIGVTLCHEMVHVSQMIRGMLKTDENGDRIWMGKKYPADMHYTNRPWELNAYARQEIIFRRALDE